MIKMQHPAKASDFTAYDTEGNTVKLSDFKGKKHVILVFNRGLF